MAANRKPRVSGPKPEMSDTSTTDPPAENNGESSSYRRTLHRVSDGPPIIEAEAEREETRSAQKKAVNKKMENIRLKKILKRQHGPSSSEDSEPVPQQRDPFDDSDDIHRVNIIDDDYVAGFPTSHYLHFSEVNNPKPSPEKSNVPKVTVQKAARMFVTSKLTVAQYKALDSDHYPSYYKIEQFLIELKKKLMDQYNDGLANAILNYFNSLEGYDLEKVRINFGIDKVFTLPIVKWEMKPLVYKAEALPVQIYIVQQNIPIRRFVPPVVHILISGVVSIVDFSKKNGNGREKALFDELDKIKAKYHQGTSDFTGPTCRKILKHFVDNPLINGYCIDALRKFAKIQSYAGAVDLTDEQIDELETAIKEFFELINTNYPGLTGKKTKLHVLKHHVIPFVREFKSWGKFSEQSLESIHHVKNETDRRIPGTSQAMKEKKR
uniref:Uncharacterized protein n=1 Tax=Panagrolaimus superbus TaxID=310955 RepID=A0A914Y5I4_9BILA